MNEPIRLHRLYILFPLVHSIKSLLPLAAILSIKFFNDKSLGDIPWYWLSAAVTLLAAILLVYGYFSWKRFVYTLEEDKILIRRGVLFREELSVYTGRIHSMNMEQPLVQRLLGLTQVRIETPGKTEDGGVLPAVTNAEGERLRRWLRERTRSQAAVNAGMPSQTSGTADHAGAEGADSRTEPDASSVPSELGAPAMQAPDGHAAPGGFSGHARQDVETPEVPALDEAEEERSTLLQLSPGRLLAAALTSPNLSLALAFVGGIASFADDLLPDPVYERLFQSAGRLLPGHWISIAVLAVLLAWLLSVVLYVVKYAGFTVERFGKQISVSFGLLEKKRLLFAPERVLAVTVKEGLIRRWFGYAEVKVHVLTSESEKHFLLHPLIRTSDVPELLATITPKFSVNPVTASPPPRAKWLYVRWKLGLATVAAAACIWFFERPGLAALLLLPLALLWGRIAHRDAGMNITGKQLTVRTRFLALSTRYIRRPQIIALEMSGTRWQRRAGLASLQVKMIVSDIDISVSGLELQEAKDVWAWFQTKKSGENQLP